jgi:hypothetical protein
MQTVCVSSTKLQLHISLEGVDRVHVLLPKPGETFLARVLHEIIGLNVQVLDDDSGRTLFGDPLLGSPQTFDLHLTADAATACYKTSTL